MQIFFPILFEVCWTWICGSVYLTPCFQFLSHYLFMCCFYPISSLLPGLQVRTCQTSQYLLCLYPSLMFFIPFYPRSILGNFFCLFFQFITQSSVKSNLLINLSIGSGFCLFVFLIFWLQIFYFWFILLLGFSLGDQPSRILTQNEKAVHQGSHL